MAVGDLFAGALLPGLVLVSLYVAYLMVRARRRPETMPPLATSESGPAPGIPRLLAALLPPVILITSVLGSILGGVATPTEAAGVGALGACLVAASHRQLDMARLREIVTGTLEISCMVFMILIGASVFALAFRGFDGDDTVRALLTNLPGGVGGAMLLTMGVIFALGFILDFIEILFVVVPIVGPVLLGMGLDPVWLGAMIAVNLQTSFLTPPFGFTLFYLRGVAPFVAVQLVMLVLLAAVPALATWLPQTL